MWCAGKMEVMKVGGWGLPVHGMDSHWRGVIRWTAWSDFSFKWWPTELQEVRWWWVEHGGREPGRKLVCGCRCEVMGPHSKGIAVEERCALHLPRLTVICTRNWLWLSLAAKGVIWGCRGAYMWRLKKHCAGAQGPRKRRWQEPARPRHENSTGASTIPHPFKAAFSKLPPPCDMSALFLHLYIVPLRFW